MLQLAMKLPEEEDAQRQSLNWGGNAPKNKGATLSSSSSSYDDSSSGDDVSNLLFKPGAERSMQKKTRKVRTINQLLKLALE